MTLEQFKQLSPPEQEDFLNSGEVFEDVSTDKNLSPSSCGESGDIVRKEKVELNDDVMLPSSKEEGSDCSSPVSAQPSPPFSYTPAPDMPSVGSDVYDGLLVDNPVELLFLVDDDVSSGRVTLHDWQIQFMMDFSHPENKKETPFYGEVCAANGSGKDKYILAACIVWICMRYKKAWGVATNGSGVQLDNQTERHIRSLCEKVNAKFGGEVWEMKYRAYKCVLTDSVITLFATDEANKAEGFHPLEMGTKLAIFASEAKAVSNEIFTALARCLGITHRVDVSSPGNTAGYFFEQVSTAIDRKEIKDIKKDINPTDRIKYHVTAYQCSHITPAEIENFAKSLPGGKNSPVFKSGIMAEFGSFDEMIVIPHTYVWKAVNKPPVWLRETYNKAGLDLSLGGAETVFIPRNGNKMLAIEAFRFEDTEDTLDYLEELFKKYDMKHPEALIFADCVGIGAPMLNSLKRRGWKNIRYIDSRAAAKYPKTYKNRATELFFNMRKLLERHELILLRDEEMMAQLSQRYYKLIGGVLHQLLSKLEQKSKGYKSPDRADALNLAFWDYESTVSDIPPEHTEPFDFEKYQEEEKEKSGATKSVFDTRSWSKGSFERWKPEQQSDFSSVLEEIAAYNNNIKRN